MKLLLLDLLFLHAKCPLLFLLQIADVLWIGNLDGLLVVAARRELLTETNG